MTYLENIKMTKMPAVPELSTVTLDQVQRHPKRPSKSQITRRIPLRKVLAFRGQAFK